MKKSVVYLVGAGPGDPGLITLKGIECIKIADVIIYDNLINKELLDSVKQDAKLIYAGKSGSFHTIEQKDINKLIIKEAKKGKTVVRLKGGDPIIFGRGAEELEILAKNRIKFEVVPGVSSAIAGPIYAGIPLTHREFASSVCFVTGHESDEKQKTKINWHNLINGTDTVVILMGMSNLRYILNEFIKGEKSIKTPVAIVQYATTVNQKVVTGTLENIEKKVKEAKITAPAIIVIGEVVNLRKKLSWFEKKPLFGKTIVITRAIKQAGVFSDFLENEGARVIEFPTIKIIPQNENSQIKNSIRNLDIYDIIIFTSVNGVAIFIDLLRKSEKIDILKRKKIYAIGPVTARAISGAGFEVVNIPSEYRAEAIIPILGNVKGKKILLPRAKEAREILAKMLREKGSIVDEVSIYSIKTEKKVPEEFKKALKSKKIDCITFTSSSTVKNFDKLVKGSNLKKYLRDIKIASIGPVTSSTLRNLGYRVDIQPGKYTLQNLTMALGRALFRDGSMDCPKNI